MLDPQLPHSARPLVNTGDAGDLVARNVLADVLLEVGKNPAMSGGQARQAEDDIEPEHARWLRRRVRAWFKASGRSFPWRERRDPYRVLIAELLLQRTRADLVLPLYEEFVALYPNPSALAAADEREVLDFLRPLGFCHRSARLPALGRALCAQHRGRVPRSKAALLALPGVGEYVANAVLALAYNQRRPLLDPNVIRLLGRVFGLRSTRARPRDDPAQWSLVEELLPQRNAADFGLALIDLGALVCLSRRPRCFECPLRERCQAFATLDVSPAAPAARDSQASSRVGRKRP
jgi:A/G-specific adenine glycosylase